MIANDFVKDIEAFKSFSHVWVDDFFAHELEKSIDRKMKELGVKPNEIFVYDPRLESLRGVCKSQIFSSTF